MSFTLKVDKEKFMLVWYVECHLTDHWNLTAVLQLCLVYEMQFSLWTMSKEVSEYR
jgi:hypothetical protein